MGGRSSHHHYHTDTESQQRAAEAQALATAAQEKANEMQRAFEKQQQRNDRLFEEHRLAQQRATEEARRAQEENRRRIEEAQQRHAAEMAEAARLQEVQRLARERAEEKARIDAEAAALRLAEEQRKRAEEAAEAARVLEEERLAAELRVKEELEQERARVHAERLRKWQDLNRTYPMPDFMKPYVSEVMEDVTADSSQDRFVNVGVLGNSGVGKSSLIKAIMEIFPSLEGDAPTPQSCVEGDGTREPTPYKLGEFKGKAFIWDIPGQGTSLFPARTYLRDMGLKYFDAILIVTDGRWSENDARLFEAIKFAQIWYMIVRTKVDQAVEAEKYDHNLSQEAALEKIQSTLSSQLAEQDPQKIHLVTIRKPFWAGAHGGLPFGAIGGLCNLISSHVETELEHGWTVIPRDEPMEVDEAARNVTLMEDDELGD